MNNRNTPDSGHNFYYPDQKTTGSRNNQSSDQTTGSRNNQSSGQTTGSRNNHTSDQTTGSRNNQSSDQTTGSRNNQSSDREKPESQNNFSFPVKFLRRQSNITQEELARQAGVGLRFIRDLEQGKETLRLDKINQVLLQFGCKAGCVTGIRGDRWEIIMTLMNRQVQIHLTNKTKLSGVLLRFTMKRKQIHSWTFLPDRHANQYQVTKDKSLLLTLDDNSIRHVFR